MRDKDAAQHCWSCGYSREGLTGNYCPECGSPKTKPLPPAPPPVDIASEIADVVVFVHHAAYIYVAAMGVFLLGVLLALVALMFV